MRTSEDSENYFNSFTSNGNVLLPLRVLKIAHRFFRSNEKSNLIVSPLIDHAIFIFPLRRLRCEEIIRRSPSNTEKNNPFVIKNLGGFLRAFVSSPPRGINEFIFFEALSRRQDMINN